MDIQVWYNATEFMNDVPAKMELDIVFIGNNRKHIIIVSDHR